MTLSDLDDFELTIQHFSLLILGDYPRILESPRVYPDVEDAQLVFKCEFKSNTKEDVARFHVSWYEELPIKQLDKTEIINGTNRVAKLQMRITSSSDSPVFRLGKKVGFGFLTISS